MNRDQKKQYNQSPVVGLMVTPKACKGKTGKALEKCKNNEWKLVAIDIYKGYDEPHTVLREANMDTGEFMKFIGKVDRSAEYPNRFTGETYTVDEVVKMIDRDPKIRSTENYLYGGVIIP